MVFSDTVSAVLFSQERDKYIMKKKIMIGGICALVVLLLGLMIWGLTISTQEHDKEDSVTLSETKKDTSAGTDEDIAEDKNNTTDSTENRTGNTSEDEQSAEAKPQKIFPSESENEIELPIDIIKEDDNSNGLDESSGDQSGKIVPDNGNELPVDKMN